MKWFLGTYSACFSRRHKLFDHVLAGLQIVAGKNCSKATEGRIGDGGRVVCAPFRQEQKHGMENRFSG